MNEPQVWTLIGVFAAVLTGMIMLVLRTMNAQFAAMNSKFDAVNSQFDTVNSRFDSLQNELKAEISDSIGLLRGEMMTEIATLRVEIGHLDRDVQAISRRVFPDRDERSSD